MPSGYDTFQEGKIDECADNEDFTAREGRLFVLRCPDCGWGVMATKKVRCLHCEAVTQIEMEVDA